MSVDPVRTAIALALLLAATIAVMSVGRVRHRRDLAVAAGRAFIQLIAVALVIAWIFTHPEGAAVYLGIMVVAAAWTAHRRIRGDRRDFLALLGAIALGAAATIAIVAVTGALSFTAQALLPFSAQMIGGAMTTAILAGMRLRDDVRDNLDLFAVYVSLGATYRQAGQQFAARAAERALVPTLDQTRSAGLVTLPGAFVGMLLGGATPLQAAQVQLLVLIGLLLVQSITALLTTRWLNPLPNELGQNVARMRDAT